MGTPEQPSDDPAPWFADSQQDQLAGPPASEDVVVPDPAGPPSPDHAVRLGRLANAAR